MQISERGVGPSVDGQSAIRAAVGKEGLTNNCGHFGEMMNIFMLLFNLMTEFYVIFY